MLAAGIYGKAVIDGFTFFRRCDNIKKDYLSKGKNPPLKIRFGLFVFA
jgi:hypothetical protein